jgi:hypothetical protein
MATLEDCISTGRDDVAKSPGPVQVPLSDILRDYQKRYTLLFINHCRLPSRPGKELCMKYMRSGECVNGACRFDHPVDRFGFQQEVTSAQKVVNLIGNVCALCSNVSAGTRDVVTTFISDLVAVLDKYFDELTAEYGSGCIIYGDSVLKLHAAFSAFRKSILPKTKNRKAGSKHHQGRDRNSAHDQKFEEQCKVLLECLQYLNTRWSDEENLFSSVLQCSVAFPVNKELLPSLEEDISRLADNSKAQQDAIKGRKESIRVHLLNIANDVINTHVHECNQDKSLLNSCVLQQFGSSANSLGLSASDLDLCLGYEESLKVSETPIQLNLLLFLSMPYDACCC